MRHLAALPAEDASALLLEVVEECRRAGVGADIVLPEEAWFLERQHERAVRALIEISAGDRSAEAMARWAWKTVQINHRTEADQIASASGAAPPPIGRLLRVA